MWFIWRKLKENWKLIAFPFYPNFISSNFQYTMTKMRRVYEENRYCPSFDQNVSIITHTLTLFFKYFLLQKEGSTKLNL